MVGDKVIIKGDFGVKEYMHVREIRKMRGKFLGFEC